MRPLTPYSRTRSRFKTFNLNLKIQFLFFPSKFRSHFSFSISFSFSLSDKNHETKTRQSLSGVLCTHKGSHELNWADRRKVTKVFDQGDFFMCWVVNALAASESKYMIQNSASGTINLSKQELLNCYFEKYPVPEGDYDANRNLYDNRGFRAGSIQKALKYIEAHGVSMEEDWPWVGVKGPCTKKPNPKKVLWVKGIEKLPQWAEGEVIKVLNKHPIAAALELTPSLKKLQQVSILLLSVSVYLYLRSMGSGATRFRKISKRDRVQGEIYSGPTDDDIKDKEEVLYHAVLVTGYGIDPVTKEKYYVIRNSWGERWADNGCGRVKRYLLSRFCYPKEVTMDDQ